MFNKTIQRQIFDDFLSKLGQSDLLTEQQIIELRSLLVSLENAEKGSEDLYRIICGESEKNENY